MSEPIERLLDAFRRLSDSDKREFLARLEEDSWYPYDGAPYANGVGQSRDNAYNNL